MTQWVNYNFYIKIRYLGCVWLKSLKNIDFVLTLVCAECYMKGQIKLELKFLKSNRESYKIVFFS